MFGYQLVGRSPNVKVGTWGAVQDPQGRIECIRPVGVWQAGLDEESPHDGEDAPESSLGKGVHVGAACNYRGFAGSTVSDEFDVILRGVLTAVVGVERLDAHAAVLGHVRAVLGVRLMVIRLAADGVASKVETVFVDEDIAVAEPMGEGWR